MSKLSLAERSRLAALLADRARRSTVASVLSSPLLRWRYGAGVADQLLIVPQDLRTADPSFWNEIEAEQFGLAGAVADLNEGSPFDLKPPSLPWARELHGFGWLRHLDSVQDPDAKAAAVAFVMDWIRRERNVRGLAWEPAVVGRRLLSWISHSNMLLDDVPARTYDRIAQSMGAQMVFLSAAWRHAPSGYQRLLALTALVMADLCVAGHDRQLADVETLFAGELDRQILPDGGHISRNPQLLVELLLDFLPLGQCFAVRERTPPAQLSNAIRRMLPMVRYMRLGDGALARFNGMGVPSPEALATVLAYESAGAEQLAQAPASRYARLARGNATVIMDIGPPPPLEMAGEAHAGCLAFEMSSGSRPIFVNGGAPGAADYDWRAASRATASHNTLCLYERSSSRLVRSKLLEEIVGAPPIRFPNNVTSRLTDHPQGVEIEASHDGYLTAFRLLHKRRLFLEASGAYVEGVDQLGPASGELRLERDLPFAIHFHLHPDAACRPLNDPNAVEIRPGSGQIWRFAARGAALSIEESAYYADLSGPRRSLQIVLRAACFGQSEVNWSLQLVTPTPRASRPELASVTAGPTKPRPPPLPVAGPPPLPPYKPKA